MARFRKLRRRRRGGRKFGRRMRRVRYIRISRGGTRI